MEYVHANRFLFAQTKGLEDPSKWTDSQEKKLAELIVVQEAQKFYEPELVKAVKKKDVHHPKFGTTIVRLGLQMKTAYGVEVIVSRSRNETQQILDARSKEIEDIKRMRLTRKRKLRLQQLEKEVEDCVPMATRELMYIPAALEERDSTSRVLLRHLHDYTGHGSENATLHEMRYTYWIPKARRILKGIRKRCKTCVRLNTRFLKEKEAPLPYERLVSERAFTALGVDFVGPFDVIGEDKRKPSILVIACASHRIVCLQATLGQDAQAFMLAYQAFQDTRGATPDIVFSDNAQAFKTAEKEAIRLKFLLTKWKFNAARAPWWGGFYERMMRVIKDFIARVFGKFSFKNWQEFVAAVAYLERLINSRPITTFSDERGEIVISPNMFIDPQRDLTFSKRVLEGFIPLFDEDRTKTAAQLVKAYRNQHAFYGRLYKQFQELYLDTLREYHPSKFFGSDERTLKVGDVVLLKPISSFKSGSSMQRNLWIQATITKMVKTPRDGRVRVVHVEWKDDSGKIHRQDRVPIQNVAPLECV
jgi:hypothetical protein